MAKAKPKRRTNIPPAQLASPEPERLPVVRDSNGRWLPGGPGRKSKLTPEMQDRIVSSLRAGNYRDVAALTSGIHEATLYAWLNRGEAGEAPYDEFLKAVKEAEAEAEAESLAIIRQAAAPHPVLRVQTTTHPDGSVETVETRSVEQSWQAGAWYLERTKQGKYRRIDRVEQTGADGGPIQVEQTHVLELSTEQLEALERLHMERLRIVGEG
jgi:transposase